MLIFTKTEQMILDKCEEVKHVMQAPGIVPVGLRLYSTFVAFSLFSDFWCSYISRIKLLAPICTSSLPPQDSEPLPVHSLW